MSRPIVTLRVIVAAALDRHARALGVEPVRPLEYLAAQVAGVRPSTVAHIDVAIAAIRAAYGFTTDAARTLAELDDAESLAAWVAAEADRMGADVTEVVS